MSAATSLESRREKEQRELWAEFETWLTNEERKRIERESRHAMATQWPAGDSWLRGYAEDVPKLLREIDRLHAKYDQMLARLDV